MTDKVAIISDIHGNMDALKAVLADIQQRGIETIYCLGDLAGKGPDGDQVVDTCRDVCEAIVRGNWDALLQNKQEHPAVQWWQAQLGPERVQYLANLPNSHDFWLSGQHVRLFHASHISEHHRIRQDAPAEKQREMFTNTDFTGFDQPEPDIVGYGDIHGAFLISPSHSRKLLFNVGSVGNPLDLPIPVYVVMSGDVGSRASGPFGIEFVRVPYDIEAQVKRAYDLQMPEAAPYASELRTAVYRHS
ncbi:metallophosphoesterase family protein [Phototrophicus methaneseepsis]|uniref:Metallophosphoesterase family protein n=1 Tax=Phototrophicus methaneseepsis TaxID=2710758 RepID=A0A7S8EA88_9CHLR|nr:metallophosphoesterase family protein [Phototrophicus methaneseepsis]QPC83207.1 metallophosphoesterase family protein [Phototrophicus methaneseepsis]